MRSWSSGASPPAAAIAGAWLAFLGLLPALGAGRPALAVEPSAEAPRLVLVLIVDQLRRDRLDARLPGGLGRILRQGFSFGNAVVDHAVTSTCPGHAVLLSGRHPGRMGVPDNRFIDRADGTLRYCVEDAAASARVFGGEGGRSPRLLRGDALGDWLKAARPAARVFSVSAKDRAAVTLGGQHPDGAYWLNASGDPGFTTSLYYRPELPEWVRDWNGRDPPRDGFLSTLPERWQHDPQLETDDLRPDDYPAESPEFRRTSGHPLRDADLERFTANLYRTPFVDLATLDFASELVRRERLGRGSAPDLLAVSLSGTDMVGHLYGPESHEARDALWRLDAALGAFLDFLEGEVGVGRILVALSADHGVSVLPEWLAETGRSQCPVEGGRVGLRRLGLGLLWSVHRSVDPWYTIPRQWLHFSGVEATVDRVRAVEQGVSVASVVAAAERHLEAHPAIAEVWTADEIRNGTGPIAELYRHSYDPERSGDIAIQFVATCLAAESDHGTSHMTPYLYDRAVPLVFFGPGVPPGSAAGAAASVDLGPTLASLLGIATPDDLDGRPLLGDAAADPD